MKNAQARDLFGPIFGGLVYYSVTGSARDASIFMIVATIVRVLMVEGSRDHDQR